MLQCEEFQVPEGYTSLVHTQQDCEGQVAVHDADAPKYTTTAPPWEGGEQVDSAELTETEPRQPIQCAITPPTYTTPATVTVLAFVGGASLIVMVGLFVTLCWLASQGVHVTGFWLTLTPSTWDSTYEDRALP